MLEAAKERGEFVEVVLNEPHSEADSEGKDFTVTKMIDGEPQTRSFGITISQRSLSESRVRHSDIPQFLFPIETKPETVLRRVNDLFK